MSVDKPSARDWIIRAAPVLRRVSHAKTRFSVAMHVNRVTMLAAADELQAATLDAMVWMMDNHSSDLRVDGQVSLMLHSCAEAAHTARRVITHPSGDLDAVLVRLANLLAAVDFGPQSLKGW